MKSTLKEIPANKEPVFPYLGKIKNTDLVVLFINGSNNRLTGTVVRGDNHWKIGEHSSYFAKECFESLPAGSQIILEQE